MRRPEDAVNAWNAINANNPRLRAIAIYIVKEYRHYAILKGWADSPRGIGAASIYLAAKSEGLRLTQRDLAESQTVMEVTLRNVSHRMHKAIPDLKERIDRFRASLGE